MASLPDRIERCRATIRQAAGDANGTAEFQKRIVDFYSAAGRSEAEAAAQAAGVRAYIEAVPDRLDRVMQSALDPEAPQSWATRHMALLEAALDAFETASVVPDHFGLAGLLDNAYVAARLLPEEIQVEIDHDAAIQLLGPFTSLQLDRQVDEIRAVLAAGAPPPEGGVAVEDAPAGTAVRGPCAECVHVRCGTPTAQAVFDNLLEAVRAPARQVFSEKLREERETSRHFIEELEALKRNGDTHFTRRPTERRMTYCGVDEFDAVSLCAEVKNLDEMCDQFAKPATPAERACATCRHNHALPATVFHVIQRVAGHISSGQPVRDEIKKTIETQAQSEYQECVEYGGFVHSGRPGTLPVCEARSAPDEAGGTGYLIGPVVNVANRCDLWEPGDNETVKRVTAELAALDADADQAWQDLSNPPVVDASATRFSDTLRGLAVNADADVIEHGLIALGVYPSSVESLCINYVSYVGQTEIVRTPRASRQQDRANAGYRAKEVPFVVEPGKIYRHPEHASVIVQCHVDRAYVEVRDDYNTPYPFQFGAFPPGAWQGLAGADGQRLRAALMVAADANGATTVHAAWI